MLNPFYDKFIFTSNFKYRGSNFFLLDLPVAISPTAPLARISAMDNKAINEALYLSTKDATMEDVIPLLKLDFKSRFNNSLKLFENFLSSSGWGEISMVDVYPRKAHAIITVKNSPIASKPKGNPKNPVDHILRGYFAGVFSKAFGRDVGCVELKCAALGDSCCEFIVKPAPEFSRDKPRSMRQLPKKTP